MHEPLKNRIYIGKKFSFNFLGSDFVAPKSGHRREKQTVLEPELIDVVMGNIFKKCFILSFKRI